MIAFSALVWLAVEAANPAETYTRAETITYFIGAALLYSLVNFHPYEIEVDIKQGGLSRFLVKPLSPHWYYTIKIGADAALATVLKAAIFIPVALAFGYAFQANLSQFVLFCLYLPFVYYVSFLLLSTISVGAFWFTEIYAVRWGLTIVFRFLSGVLLPFDYFPEWAQSILILSPFPHLAATPIRLLQGAMPISQGLQNFAILLAWTVILHLINQTMWKRGVREYEGTGM